MTDPYARYDPDAFPQPLAWITPTLQNGWVNAGGTFESVGYRREPGGIVRLKGSVKNGTLGAAIFALPTGSRPAAQLPFAVDTAGGTTIVNVNADGTVTVSASANNARVSFNGVAFAV